MVSGDGHAHERKDSNRLGGHVHFVEFCDQPLLGQLDLFVWQSRRVESCRLEGADEVGGDNLRCTTLALKWFARRARMLDSL
jgi:hypothetical protein